MMMTTPLVSVITVTYNTSAAVEETIRSVLDQDYPSIEYIIIDGGSSDGTADAIRKYEDRLSYWVSEPDKGIYDAMNKGIRRAKGEIIGMINAGDSYQPAAIARVVNAAMAQPRAGIFHGNINMIDLDGDFLKEKKPDPDIREVYQGMSVYHPTFFVRREVYEQTGLFDTNYLIAADFDFAVRAMLQGISFHYIDEVIANYRMGGVSQTSGERIRQECKAILQKNGYAPDTVEAIYRSWLRKDWKVERVNRAYAFLKRIVPRPLLNYLAKNIRLK